MKVLRIVLLITTVGALTIGLILDCIGDNIFDDENSPFGYDVQFQIIKTSVTIDDEDVRNYIIQQSNSRNVEIIYDVYDRDSSERRIYPIGNTDLENKDIVDGKIIRWFKREIKGHVVAGGYLYQNPYIGVYRMKLDDGTLKDIETYLNDRSLRIQISRIEENYWSWITVPTRILILVSLLSILTILLPEKVIGITKSRMVYLHSKSAILAYAKVNSKFYLVLILVPAAVLLFAYYANIEYELYNIDRYIAAIILSYFKSMVALLLIVLIVDLIFFNNDYTSRSNDEYTRGLYHRVAIIQIISVSLLAINSSHIAYSQSRLRDLDANWRFWSRYPYVGFMDASLPLETYEFNHNEDNSINKKGSALLASIGSKTEVYLCTPIYTDVETEASLFIVSESYLNLISNIHEIKRDLDGSEKQVLDSNIASYQIPTELESVWKKNDVNLSDHSYLVKYNGHPIPLIYHGASGGMIYRNSVNMLVIDNPTNVFRVDTFLSNEIRNANLFFADVHTLSNDVEEAYPSYLAEFNTFQVWFRNLYDNEVQTFRVLSLSIYSSIVSVILIFYVSISCFISLHHRKYVLLSIASDHYMVKIAFVLMHQFVQLFTVLVLLTILYVFSEQLQSVVDIVQVDLIVMFLFLLHTAVILSLFERSLKGDLRKDC